MSNFKFKFLMKCLSCNKKLLSTSTIYLGASESNNPIVQKYTKILKDLKAKTVDSSNEGFIYHTNFGSVRFDSIVTDSKSKEKEAINFPYKNSCTNSNLEFQEITSLDKENFSDKSLENELNYIDSAYFHDSFSTINDNKEINLNSQKLKSFNKENFHDQSLDHDFNYIDTIYFQEPLATRIHDKSCMENRRSITNHNAKNIDIVPNYSLNYKEKVLSKPSDKFEDTFNIDNKFSFEDINEKIESEETFQAEDLDIIGETTENLENKIEILKQEASKLFPGQLKAAEDKKITQSKDKIEIKNFEEIDKIKIHKKDETANNVYESAFDYVKEKRKQEHISKIKELQGTIAPNEKYKKILLHVPRYSHITKDDFIYLLKRSVLYNDNDFIAISKPYGVRIHGGSDTKRRTFDIVSCLPELAQILKIKDETLYPVHRLDMQTTGVILLAKTEPMADKLKSMFKQHLIRKTYIAITKNVPNSYNGVIDIPIGQGKVDSYERMVLQPDIEGYRYRSRAGKSKKAVTRYKVLSCTHSSSLLELNPVTGVKHQIRVHLGFGIDCPILGDHKYSYLNKMAPQKLPSDSLNLLGLKQPAVRHLPIFLHALTLEIPGIKENGMDINIKIGPPKFFKMTLKALRLTGKQFRINEDYSDIIY